jgi:cytochrome c oxidase subunit 2
MAGEAERYEKAFLTMSGVMLVFFLGALFYAAFAMGKSLPGRGGTIDPAEAASTPPFDDPGLARTGPGRYRAVVMAQAWAFTPREFEVPAGSTVDFVITSRDVVHGFHIDETRVNGMVLPGQITRISHTFEEPGEHLVICHEYCGVGHHNMYATVEVEPRDEVDDDVGDGEERDDRTDDPDDGGEDGMDAGGEGS